MFSMVFGCTKFHNYIYGVTNVTVESDHKPLKAILKSHCAKHACDSIKWYW